MLEEIAEVALTFTGCRPFLGFAHPTQARQRIRQYRVQHCFIYGLAFRLGLPRALPFDDAVCNDGCARCNAIPTAAAPHARHCKKNLH